MSERAKHTPGPWVARDFPAATWAGSRRYVTDGRPDVDGRFVGQVIAAPTTCPDWDANALLIAAAPDLLAACIAYRDARETDDFDRTAERREQLLAAIAKATGSPP